MRTLSISAILAVLVIGGYIVYRFTTPPAFSIRKIDHLNKNGVFSFGGVENYFGLTTQGNFVGTVFGFSTKWSLKVHIKNNQVIFDLLDWPTGDFIKTLHIEDFN